MRTTRLFKSVFRAALMVGFLLHSNLSEVVDSIVALHDIQLSKRPSDQLLVLQYLLTTLGKQWLS